jgi:hypothetical protein
MTRTATTSVAGDDDGRGTDGDEHESDPDQRAATATGGRQATRRG